jgi:hypothetical protein
MTRNEYSSNSTIHSGFNTPNSTAEVEINTVNTITVNSDLIKLIKFKLKKSRKKHDFTYHYLYFCHVIGYLKNSHKKFKDTEYANIHYKTMVSIISKYKYSEIVSNLLSWGIIATDDEYQAGFKSKGYKLLPPYDVPNKTIIIKDDKINMKLTQFKNKSLQQLKKMPESYNYLHISNTWIKMDYSTASTYNNAFYFTEPDSYNANFYSICNYRDLNHKFQIDKSNRIHTNLTNLKSDFRRFLSVQGEKLGQVDIRNSQPLFLYLVIKDNPEIPDTEKQEYRQLVEEGRFYEMFMEKLNLTADKRKEVKEMTYKYIFYGESRNIDKKYLNIFREKFPNILGFINQIKNPDYKQFAILLQKAESRFVIGKVVPEFIQRNSTTQEFVSTIHDSIVVKASKLNEAKQIMAECFKLEGIEPKLEISLF